MLSKNGTMQVRWHTLEEKKVLLKLVQNVLVPESGQRLIIRPDKQQAWINYKEPFKLSWCDESTEYKLKGPRLFGLFSSLFPKREAIYAPGLTGKEKYAEGTPELKLFREQFKKEYLIPFDKIESKYLSSPKKAWEELKKFAATLPEPVMSQFLRILDTFDSKDGPEPLWFEQILFRIRQNTWTTLIEEKIAETSQIREN